MWWFRKRPMDRFAESEKRELEELKDISEGERLIVKEIRKLRHLVEDFLFPPRPQSFQINQIGDNMSVGKITGIPVGGTGVFSETDLPANSVDPVGSVRKWGTDDSVNTAITPSADNKQVAVAVGASAPVGGQFNLSFTDTFPDGTSASSGPIPVPFLAAAAVKPNDFRVDQVS